MLKVFTSYTPGAGKSYLMVQKAMEEKEKGKKVVVGFLHSGHRDVSRILEDNGIEDEYNKKGLKIQHIINQHPDIVLLDEMGMKVKNQGFVYDVIEKMLNMGIDVYTTSNLKRFESVNPLFKHLSGIGIKTTIPDRFLDMADEIYFVDRVPELLVKDFQSGKLFGERYMKSDIMHKNFRIDTLTSYRELSLSFLKEYQKKHKAEVIIVERK